MELGAQNEALTHLSTIDHVYFYMIRKVFTEKADHYGQMPVNLKPIDSMIRMTWPLR
jgi:hypothetical protein